jgi:pimeloyl-ACP methyl ester carboxylesterase
MSWPVRGAWIRLCVAGVVAGSLLGAPEFALASDKSARDAGWDALHERSREALIALAQRRVSTDGADSGVYGRPRTIVVGFTGGLEGSNSSVSGVVRMRRKLDEQIGQTPGVVALTYNNFSWRRAARDVAALALPDGPVSPGPRPLIVVYGHSWGAGAIAKFAREVRRDGLEISLAIYIDAVAVRNPRVPDNVQYAVNFYQRTGILRGWPLRGKRKLVPQSPEAGVVLANLRIRPETEHFGWNWNLVQPLLYRHHHRMSHDLRLQQYLLEIITMHLQADDDTPS